MIQHMSDCSVHNGPALPVGPCDCGAETTAINNFLDLCAPSLDPETFEHITEGIWRLCETRRLDKSLIHPWGITEPTA